MDQQLLELEKDMSNYQKVKELILSKLIEEGLLEKDRTSLTKDVRF